MKTSLFLFITFIFSIQAFSSNQGDQQHPKEPCPKAVDQKQAFDHLGGELAVDAAEGELIGAMATLQGGGERKSIDHLLKLLEEKGNRGSLPLLQAIKNAKKGTDGAPILSDDAKGKVDLAILKIREREAREEGEAQDFSELELDILTKLMTWGNYFGYIVGLGSKPLPVNRLSRLLWKHLKHPMARIQLLEIYPGLVEDLAGEKQRLARAYLRQIVQVLASDNHEEHAAFVVRFAQGRPLDGDNFKKCLDIIVKNLNPTEEDYLLILEIHDSFSKLNLATLFQSYMREQGPVLYPTLDLASVSNLPELLLNKIKASLKVVEHNLLENRLLRSFPHLWYQFLLEYTDPFTDKAVTERLNEPSLFPVVAGSTEIRDRLRSSLHELKARPGQELSTLELMSVGTLMDVGTRNDVSLLDELSWYAGPYSKNALRWAVEVVEARAEGRAIDPSKVTPSPYYEQQMAIRRRGIKIEELPRQRREDEHPFFQIEQNFGKYISIYEWVRIITLFVEAKEYYLAMSIISDFRLHQLFHFFRGTPPLLKIQANIQEQIVKYFRNEVLGANGAQNGRRVHLIARAFQEFGEQRDLIQLKQWKPVVDGSSDAQSIAGAIKAIEQR